LAVEENKALAKPEDGGMDEVAM